MPYYRQLGNHTITEKNVVEIGYREVYHQLRGWKPDENERKTQARLWFKDQELTQPISEDDIQKISNVILYLTE